MISLNLYGIQLTIVLSVVCHTWVTLQNFLLVYVQVCPNDMVAVVNIVSRHGLSIHACCTNQPNKSKLALYKPLIHIYSHLKHKR